MHPAGPCAAREGRCLAGAPASRVCPGYPEASHRSYRGTVRPVIRALALHLDNFFFLCTAHSFRRRLYTDSLSDD